MKKIIIISGDPISINSEIIFKKGKNKQEFKKILIISNYKLLNEQFKIEYNINLLKLIVLTWS